ncbi:MAG: hypothetical protein ACP5JB_00710 [candidate division WOR-3 bacterium]
MKKMVTGAVKPAAAGNAGLAIRMASVGMMSPGTAGGLAPG